jgi:hypothetical protein
MTEELHCYENANAERLNEILKQEYGLCISLRSRHSGWLMRRWFFTTPAALILPLILKRLKTGAEGRLITVNLFQVLTNSFSDFSKFFKKTKITS